MTITPDPSLTGWDFAAAISAPLGRRGADPCRRPASTITQASYEAAAPQRDTAAAPGQPEQHFPAYYLGRPAQIWIDAMSGRGKVGSATPANSGRGWPT